MKNSAKHHRTRRHAKDSNGKSRVPSLRYHKASAQGYVVLNGKAVYLGRHGEAATQQKYHQVISEWMTAGRQLPGDPDSITIKELVARFWVHGLPFAVSRLLLDACSLREGQGLLLKIIQDVLIQVVGVVSLDGL